MEWEALTVLRGRGGRCARARCQEKTRNAAHAVVRELGGIGPDGGRAIARAQGIRVQNGHRITPTRRIGSTAWRVARRKTGEKWTLMAHSSLRIGWRGRARWWKMQCYDSQTHWKSENVQTNMHGSEKLGHGSKCVSKRVKNSARMCREEGTFSWARKEAVYQKCLVLHVHASPASRRALLRPGAHFEKTAKSVVFESTRLVWERERGAPLAAG